MADTIDQVEDAWLEGIADFERFVMEFDKEFFAPLERRMMMLNFATITPQEMEMMRKIIPAEMATIEEQMKNLMEVRHGGT